MEKCSGFWEDERVRIQFQDIVRFSGSEAYDRLDTILRRISVKRFEQIEPILKAIRYFGGVIEFVHRDDIPEWALETEVRCYRDEGDGPMGIYIPMSSWIEIPTDRHKGWGSIEETLRHELIHLLQDVVTKDRTDPVHTLLSDHVLGSFGQYMSGEFKKASLEIGDVPAFEVEAHTYESWKATVVDISEEVQRRTELWEGNYMCHLID